MATGEEVVVTEEVQARRTVIRRAGNNDHSRRHCDELSILINQDPCSRSCHTRTSSDNDWLRCLETEKHHGFPTAGNQPKIQKVPERRRKITQDNHKSYYDPLVVSIGPIHHGNEELREMEKFKRHLTRKFAEACYKEKGIDLDNVYDKVAEIAESARSCYAYGLTEQYDHTTFARMMFVDGCFVLQYIHSTVGGNTREMKMKSDDIAFVRGDLLLLENQLPFQVLQALISCRFNDNEEGMKMINKFIKRLRPDPPHKRQSGWITNTKNLIRDLCFPNTDPEEGPVHQDSTPPAHLLELLRRRLIKCTSATGSGGSEQAKGGDEWFSYRSATELKKVGIHFSPAKNRCFSEIRLNSSFHYARLILPPVTIDDSSKSLFLNLVAYEACPDSPDDFGISSFLSFMDSLIDDAEDVKELRKKGVVFNLLGSDHDVAELFNEISRDLVPNPHYYAQVKRDIQSHYKNKGRVWITEWKHTYFSSPWTLIAFLAATFVIAMDVFQTILTYIQTFKKKSS
ncbi:UPF0481 protein At3g47200-like [Ipomoea triloba]|uniref:UPF0481 protein At3g47200-like n=1 Tax=Ipomoea triloba TaxID=35885 RepID=UPI00125D1C39|nr:UPF0481 protein At3g47200-like [Ipomoea triloba]